MADRPKLRHCHEINAVSVRHAHSYCSGLTVRLMSQADAEPHTDIDYRGLWASVVISLLSYTALSYRNRKVDISGAPTKAKSREPAYSKALNQNRQRSKSRELGWQTVRRLWWMVFGVDTGRQLKQVWGRG